MGFSTRRGASTGLHYPTLAGGFHNLACSSVRGATSVNLASWRYWASSAEIMPLTRAQGPQRKCDSPHLCRLALLRAFGRRITSPGKKRASPLPKQKMKGIQGALLVN